MDRPEEKAANSKDDESQYRLDTSLLPLHFDVIPDHVTSLKQCAEHQIRALLDKEQNANPATARSCLTREDEDCLDDGFVLCDLAVPCQKLRAWRLMFPRVDPFYALKCNPDPMVAAVLAQLHAGFDCASVAELELARASLKRSNNKNDDNNKRYFRIVYANPQRAEQDLETALALFEHDDDDDQRQQQRSPPLTFDGPEELYKVHSAYQKQLERWNNNNNSNNSPPPPPQPPDLILRLLVPDEHSSVPLGEKFGAAATDVHRLVELAHQLRLPVIGVSFHCGSGNHDPNSYSTAIRLAATALAAMNRQLSTAEQVGAQEIVPSAAQHQQQRCWLLDIGGGYPGVDGMMGDENRFCGSRTDPASPSSSPLDATEKKETTLQIAQVVTPLIDELFPPASDDDDYDDNHAGTNNVQIISEPGRYFVEGAFALCSRVYRVTVERGDDGDGVERRHYYIAQGVQGVFKDCLLCSETFIPIPLSVKDDDGDDKQKRSTESTELILGTVHGPSGEDYDVICRDYPLPVLEIGDWLIFDRLGAYTLSIAARNGRPPVRYVMRAQQVEDVVKKSGGLI